MNCNRKTKTRREFIKQSSIAVGMFPLLYGCGQSFKSSKSSFDPYVINGLRKKFSGQIILPGNVEYEVKRRAGFLNPDMDKHPAIIAVCKNEQDVLRSVDFAQQHQLEIAVRSGNHSNMGWGTCENGIVVDLSQMKGVTVDPDKKTAFVTTGATAEEIIAATAPYGLAPVLGQCGSVGAGLVLGGGLGWLSGKYGAACDNLIGARVITAENLTLNAHSSTNEDLFWGFGVAVATFGIAISFEYQLHSISEMLGGKFVYPIRKGRSIVRFFNEFMSKAPDELQADCYLTNEKCWVEFVYVGNLGQGELLLDEFRKFEKPEEDSVKRRAFSDVFNMYVGDSSTPCQFLSSKGSYVERLSDQIIDFILKHLEQRPTSCEVFFNLSHFMHGEVCRVLPTTTAFELRQLNAVHLAFWVTWQDPVDTSACMEWHSVTYERLQAYSGRRIFANYMSIKEAQQRKQCLVLISHDLLS